MDIRFNHLDSTIHVSKPLSEINSRASSNVAFSNVFKATELDRFWGEIRLSEDGCNSALAAVKALKQITGHGLKQTKMDFDIIASSTNQFSINGNKTWESTGAKVKIWYYSIPGANLVKFLSLVGIVFEPHFKDKNAKLNL